MHSLMLAFFQVSPFCVVGKNQESAPVSQSKPGWVVVTHGAGGGDGGEGDDGGEGGEGQSVDVLVSSTPH